MNGILTVALVLGLLHLSVGLVIIFAVVSKKKKGLSTDADFVNKMLPGIDCGMCGNKNCVEFAKKVAGGANEPEDCKLIKLGNAEKIKEYFKPTYNQSTKKVAFVKCKGGCKAEDKYIYRGAKSCAIQERLHSGSKSCKYACLGCGDCVEACKYRAITINKRGTAEVIRSKCTGCGACVKVCPNQVIGMQNLELSVGVVCNNQSSNPAITKKCEVGCSHCGVCIKTCPVGAIKVVDNVPVIDHEKCIECYKCVAVCPNHTISRL